MPEEYGGGGVPDYRYNAIVSEEMVRIGASGVGFVLQNDVVAPYLLRLCNDGLIPEARLRSICSDLMIGVDSADLRRARLTGHGT